MVMRDKFLAAVAQNHSEHFRAVLAHSLKLPIGFPQEQQEEVVQHIWDIVARNDGGNESMFYSPFKVSAN